MKNNISFGSLYLTLVLFSVTFLPVTFAQEAVEATQELPEQKIVIKNVQLVNPKDKSKSTTVNLIIINKIFDSVTQDTVEVVNTDILFDAQEGYILGSLEVGKVASFMILDANPHNNIDALLDTKKHVLLAIHDGIIIRNNLKRESNLSSIKEQKEQKQDKPKRATWLAYTPPPIIIPSSYKEADWINFNNDYFSTVLIGALALDRQSWQSQNEESLTQVGDLDSYNGGEIRALRFGAAGQIHFDTPWIYVIGGATNAFDKGFDTKTTDGVSFFDWRLDIPAFANTTLSIGKQKEPISMERLIGMVYLPMQERTVVSDTLLPSRNVGAVLSGTALNQRVAWAGGIFNDWLDDEGGLSDNDTQVIGRTSWLPYLSTDESELIHLGLGMRYSQTKESLRFASEPEFDQSPLFVDSGEITADDTLTYNIEGSWRKGPLWVVGEYTQTKVNAAYLEDPTLSGYHVSGVLSLTGEMRDYNKKSGTFSPLSVSRGVEQGGWGALEVSTRWSQFDGSDKGLLAGDTSVLSVGLSWWLNAKFNLNWNYRWVTLDRCSHISAQCDLEGKSRGFNTRLTLFL